MAPPRSRPAEPAGNLWGPLVGVAIVVAVFLVFLTATQAQVDAARTFWHQLTSGGTVVIPSWIAGVVIGVFIGIFIGRRT